MLTHRGFSAWIVVDGRNVPEYLTAVDTTANRVSCWIPSDEGQTFSVYWRDHGGKVDSCAFINLDGYVVPGRFLFGEGMTWRGGVRTSQATERPFMFQKVPENADGSANKDIGTIVLRIKRVKRVAAHIPNVIQSVPGSALGKRKAGDVYAGFGEEKPFYRQYSSTWAVEAYDKHESGSKQPATYVSFVFRYRTPEFLESQGITPSVKADIMKNPKRPEMGRRVVSVPAPPLPSLMTPSPSPSPPKKPRLEPSFSRNVSYYIAEFWAPHPNSKQGSQRLRRPSADMRRARRARSCWHNHTAYPCSGIACLIRNVEGRPSSQYRS
ncbi:hypothetical protein BDQ12DRAFT_696056 [Crucibulum laeve]|uniref:DUF7918 domain-containing protein n=1 Tax=Crucibulum laeve TaxID=68775 RepID=A0A5C3MMQ7_9AGAR|nr:hypothetical protein BDQ12DRAFT_696056 [Crucibulum laeve]